ncbi:MAG: hemerythrin-like metal-binding protein [Colwellia sp.]|jgi:hemerythrin-like metal-binding protein
MKYTSLSSQPDVILVYQDHDTVAPAIEKIKDLDLKFIAYQLNRDTLHKIAIQKPKTLLLSSNNVKKTIQYYINFLEEYGQKIAPHCAILLINNRESSSAYLACENGLFDNYVIINPFNEPHRLKLVLLKELQLIENHKNDNLEKLISESEDEFISCIKQGVALKNTFMQEVNQCESNLLSTVNKVIGDDEVKTVLKNMIAISLEQMHGNISKTTQSIIDQLITLKQNNQLLKEHIEVTREPKIKTAVGVNTKLLTADNEGKKPTLSYKVLIAEPSDLFSRVINEIFAQTVFKYLLVNDGETALAQIADFKPDVILMAYDLPKFNGIEVTKALRKEGNNTPIIAYTHLCDKKMIKRWIPLGLSGYIIKPSKKSIILKNITQAVKSPIEILHHKDSDKEYIQWIPEYSVGNKEMDEQHKTLFIMINDFFHQDSKEEVVKIFQRLTTYVDIHFKAEENLLSQINYPKTTEHIIKHHELTDKFHLLENKLDDYNIDLHHKISTFLYNWLTSHILKSDMDYKTYALSIEETSFVQKDG